MGNGLDRLYPAILAAAVTALVAAPILTRLATRIGLVDLPGSAPHKVHARATPLAGGPTLALAIAAAYIVLRAPIDPLVLGILAGGLIMLAWGLLDDRWSLPPYAKFVGQVGACALLVLFGVQVRATQIAWLDFGLTFLWVVGLTNAFNFVDSMDGLALGLGGIATAFFMLATLDAGQPGLAFLTATVLGASLGVFFHNASPAKLFLGDSGAQLLGFILAGVGIAYVPAGAGLPQGVSWFTPILVLGVPIFDTVLVVVSRFRRRLPIYRARNDHTYHRLVALGLHPARSVVAMQLAAVLLGLVAFVALQADVLTANLIFGSIVALGAVGVAWLERAAAPTSLSARAEPVSEPEPAVLDAAPAAVEEGEGRP